MKDYLKNPNFYYILAPAIITLWTVYVWAASLPAAQKTWTEKLAEREKTRDLATKILAVDPERLNYDKQTGTAAEFDYTSSIDQFAKVCGISPSDYSLLAGKIIKRSGRKTKSADITINSINIERFAKFLSALLIRWPELQCDTANLTKLSSGPDAWKAAVKFTYYY